MDRGVQFAAAVIWGAMLALILEGPRIGVWLFEVLHK